MFWGSLQDKLYPQMLKRYHITPVSPSDMAAAQSSCPGWRAPLQADSSTLSLYAHARVCPASDRSTASPASLRLSLAVHVPSHLMVLLSHPLPSCLCPSVLQGPVSAFELTSGSASSLALVETRTGKRTGRTRATARSGAEQLPLRGQ